MKKQLIEPWEKTALIISTLVLVISAVLEIFISCLTISYPTIVSIATGLAGGVIATIIILYIERKHEQTKLFDYFSKFEGTYTRIDIGQDNTSVDKLKPMRSDNIGLSINMNYIGGHEFMLDINYWKSENALAKGFIEFNPKDKKSAKGNYRYIEGNSYKGHYGSLELSWDENRNEIIVFFHHQYPRELPFNPDNNRGWEVWKKI